MIKDSGNRRKFDTGAVRDIQEGKGRCDLLPLDVVGNLWGDPILQHIAQFQETQNTVNLEIALCDFCKAFYGTFPEMILDVSKHFEEGSKKYGENNWQKGLPVNCYIDSAVRHYLK